MIMSSDHLAVRCLKRAAILLASVFLLALPQPSAAQNTTSGSLSGVVQDPQGGVLPGVTVEATHVPTGTQYTTVTESDGRFVIPSVRVGGPYSVAVSLSGFRPATQNDINVGLGEERNLTFKLSLQTVSESVTVTAEAAPVFSPGSTGTASNVSSEQIQNLPTISRSLTDFARVSPYFNQTSFNGGDSYLSVAGRNQRYNALQIDGAINNDLFGVATSGTPGAQTGTQPISLDAIQELQLVVAPYDVRQGGFSGGGVNAITKSGSNQLAGTAYTYGRNESWVGQGPDVCSAGLVGPSSCTPGADVGTFSDKQGGASLGGPIVKNKAFFFGNADFGRKVTPTGFSVDGTSGQNWGHQADAQRVRDILRSVYNYDPGGLGEFSRRNDNNKGFVRTDFNLSSKHRLTVRHNYVHGLADVGSQSQFTYQFPDNFYVIQDTTNSTVTQLDSTLGKAFNQLRVTYQRERNHREPQPGFKAFPSVLVDLPDATKLQTGFELSSHANALDQDILELTDDYTIIRGSHTWTVGTHNEIFKFRNLFIQNLYGSYEFSSIDNLAAGNAQSYSHGFSNTSDPMQAARFRVRQYGVYAGDQWRVAPRFTLTYGVRYDKPQFPDVPSRNPVSETNFGYRTDVVPVLQQWSPRVGFNWNLSDTAEVHQQVRGGIGIFSGRTPYVWLSNQYGNTGIDFSRVSVSFNTNNSVKFVPDPNNQPTNVGGAQTNEIDLVDPDYKFPQLMRGNVALDRSLGFGGLIGTAEVLFSKNIEDVRYNNVNFVISGARPDGRPIYSRVVNSLSNVILLTNTTQGDQVSVSFKAEKPFRNHYSASGSYLYGRANSTMDIQNSTAGSNWGQLFTSADVNNPPLTRSIYDVGHRISLSATAEVPIYKQSKAMVSVYYNGQSGQPYSTNFTGDVNGDTRTTNDIIFVPGSANDVVLSCGTLGCGGADPWTVLDKYIGMDNAISDLRGKLATRNTGRSPWTNTMDLHTAVNIPTSSRAKVELTMDILNLINLLDHQKGVQMYPNFNDILAIRANANSFVDANTGKEIYDISPLLAPNFSLFIRDDLRSRWQAQWGVRVRF